MRVTTEPTLYFDPQATVRIAFCPLCGGSTYPPGYGCLRCARREDP